MYPEESPKIEGCSVCYVRRFQAPPFKTVSQKIREKLLGMGMSPRIVRIIADLYSKAILRVRSSEGLTKETNITERGTARGDLGAPDHHSVYLGYGRCLQIKGFVRYQRKKSKGCFTS